MDIAVYYWHTGEFSQTLKDSIASQFLGWNYYSMSRDKADIQQWLNDLERTLINKELTNNNYCYYEVATFMQDKGILKYDP